jgi:hypothetical protein
MKPLLAAEVGEENSRRGLAGRAFARIVIPALLVLAGTALIVLGDGALGLALFLAVPVIATFNWFVRLSLRSQGDRDREQAARDKLARTGKW